MFSDTQPRAGIFVGGMHDVLTEVGLLKELDPVVWIYPVARAGGESANLTRFAPQSVREPLSKSNIYPTLFRKVVEDLASRLAHEAQMS